MRHATVSIIVCTCDRADSLRLTLESIRQCHLLGEWQTELLVIDNGSTDHTRQIVEQVAMTNMAVRYQIEPCKGKGYAYNSGMAAATGDIFLFTDDDVRVPQNWIEGMCRCIFDDSADAVAGGVTFPPDLRLPGDCDPSWMASTEALDPVRPSRIVGANMAFHRRVLDRVPAFDVELGPGALGFSDETLFSWQLIDAGYRFVGQLDVTVEHHFDPARLSRQALLATAVKLGQSEAYVDYHWSHSERQDGWMTKFRTRAGLSARRLLRWKAHHHPETVMRWELERVRSNAYLDHLAVERQRPRNYEKRGLRKVRGKRWPAQNDPLAGATVGTHVEVSG